MIDAIDKDFAALGQRVAAALNQLSAKYNRIFEETAERITAECACEADEAIASHISELQTEMQKWFDREVKRVISDIVRDGENVVLH